MTQSLGGTLGQYVRPIRRVGIYVPAGTRPLPSSVLMSAIPAQVAGVQRDRPGRPAQPRNRRELPRSSWPPPH